MSLTEHATKTLGLQATGAMEGIKITATIKGQKRELDLHVFEYSKGKDGKERAALMLITEGKSGFPELLLGSPGEKPPTELMVFKDKKTGKFRVAERAAPGEDPVGTGNGGGGDLLLREDTGTVCGSVASNKG